MWNSPPAPTLSHEHIKNTSTRGTILTGNWQKDSYTTKAERKIHIGSSRKGREVIKSRPVTQGGDSEEKWDHTGRHIGRPSPGVQHREDKSSWLVGGPVGKWTAGKIDLDSMLAYSKSLSYSDKATAQWPHLAHRHVFCTVWCMYRVFWFFFPELGLIARV